MKRKRIYKPRRGIHFDRSIPQGPAASFLGDSVQVVEFTGSVQRSATQNPGVYHYETVPFAGYPRTPGQMQLAFGGRGTWVDGYLLEEFDTAITSSFDPTHTMVGQTTDRITFRMPGFRGPADDHAIGFIASGTVGNVANFNPDSTIGTGSYALTAASDLAVLWVGRGLRVGDPNDAFAYMFSKGDGGLNGWALKHGGSGASGSVAIQVEIHGVGTTRLNTTLPLDSENKTGWFVGLLAFERGIGRLCLSTMDLVTQQVDTVYRDISAIGDKSAPGSGFKFGGAFSSVYPASQVYSAFYIASGTNGVSGVVGNEQTLMRNFAKVLGARNGYLFSGSLEVQNSIGSFGTAPSTSFVTQRLLGLGTASLGRSRGYVQITTGTIPSWTNAHIVNSAFVISSLSSSDHEVQVMGMWKSGSEAVESSPVPASASMYYSKHGRFTKTTVKKTASVEDLARLPTGMDGGTPVYYVPGKGTDITSVTGTLQYLSAIQNSMQRSNVLLPAMIPIPVNLKGKIVDLKVWIEMMQTSGTHNAGLDGGYYPLGGLAIALRSPNVRGFHAHPIRNDEAIKKVFTSNLGDFSAAGAFGVIGRSMFGPDYIAPFYRDSFILWEGPAIFGEGTNGPWDSDTEANVGEHYVTRKYPAWQRDRSMRTVFSDGAPIPNPRHHIGVPMSGNYNGSPNASRGFNNAYGFDVPWTSETEISGAGTYVTAGSPPKGWLNGPGGSNLPDEWPTTGVNYGADYIRPLYPMLDPLYQRKRYGDVLTLPSTGSAIFDPGKWTGYRPGLRGTEVSGTWYLMVADHRAARNTATSYTPTYLRQVRLEFTLASGSYTDLTPRRASKQRARRAKDEVLVLTISGSDLLYGGTGSWDCHISDTYLYRSDGDVSPEVARTIGIGFLTGSAETGDFALLYKLTGTLADVSGSTPGWLLNNRFGTPVIPLSSASLVETSFSPAEGVHPQDLLVDRAILDGARRLTEAGRDANPPLTLVQKYAARLSGTAI